MRRGKKVITIVIGVICFVLFGCSEEEQKNEAEKFQSDYMEVGVTTVVDEGWFQKIGGLYYFFDFETKKAVPLCNKPDCRHLSAYEDRGTTCNAAREEFSKAFPYKGELYRFSRTETGQELVTSGFDGSNQKSKGEFITGDIMIHQGVIRENQLFYVYDESPAYEEIENVEAIRQVWHLGVLDLDTMENEEIFSADKGMGLQLLGGTKEFQIYAVTDLSNYEAVHYYFDYETRESEEIQWFGDGFATVLMNRDETVCYYPGGEENQRVNIYEYDVKARENRVCVSEEEIQKAGGGDKVFPVFADKEKIVYCTDMEKKMFVKDMESGKIRELSLPQNLPQEDAVLNSILCVTEEGCYFDYFKYNPIAEREGDWITWYGYISWENLLEEKNAVTVILNPRVTSAGNLVDSEGNPIEAVEE